MEEIARNLPASVRLLIERQFEHSAPDERRLLEAASVAGSEFSAEVIAAGLEKPSETVEDRCERLAQRGVFINARGTEVLPSGAVTGRYGFIHALYQQVVYEHLTAVQHPRLHHRIGEGLERVYGSRVEERAAELAVHFERGHDGERTLRYLTQAGRNAMQRSASREAIALLTRGRELLKSLPEIPDRRQQELDLLIALKAPLTITKGYAAPEVEAICTRARELCQQLGETPQLFTVLAGLAEFYIVRTEFRIGREFAEQCLRLAQRVQDSALLVPAHYVLGVAYLYLGELVPARTVLEQGIALHDPQKHGVLALLYGQDPGIVSRAFASWTLWFLGYPDQALEKSHEALAMTQQLSYSLSLAFALHSLAWLHCYRREGPAAQERAETELALANEQGFPIFVAVGTAQRGWALTEQGQMQEGLAQLRQGIAGFEATGALIARSYHLALLAEAYGKAGQFEEGLHTLADALGTVEKTGERYYKAEIYRIKGELLLAQESKNQKAKGKRQKQLSVGSSQLSVPSPQPLTSSTQAEAYFQKAIEIARRQQAKSLELRAVMSLARLWQQQGKHHEAHQMLSDLYHWFTEGFDTADLKEAKALLKALA